jgi:hypothetical protein
MDTHMDTHTHTHLLVSQSFRHLRLDIVLHLCESSFQLADGDVLVLQSRYKTRTQG